MENQLADGTVADDGQRETIRRQGETFDAVEFLDRRMRSPRRCGAQPPNLVVDDDQPVAVP